jgi:hypothetical protein
MVDGCEETPIRKSLCNKHHLQARKTGRAGDLELPELMKKCSHDGCDAGAVAHGLCNKHYLRFWATGTDSPGPRAQMPLLDGFWKYVDKQYPDECWEWYGDALPSGYGRIQSGGKGSKMCLAHRLSYTIHHGEIPDGFYVIHSCDNPGCVNPNHLSAGRPIDNTYDMIHKGRHRYGVKYSEDAHNAQLTEEIVREIKRNPKKTHAELARQFNVSTGAVRNVRLGLTWSHVV